jgi:hypothetical protein
VPGDGDKPDAMVTDRVVERLNAILGLVRRVAPTIAEHGARLDRHDRQMVECAGRFARLETKAQASERDAARRLALRSRLWLALVSALCGAAASVVTTLVVRALSRR